MLDLSYQVTVNLLLEAASERTRAAQAAENLAALGPTMVTPELAGALAELARGHREAANAYRGRAHDVTSTMHAVLLSRGGGA